MSLNPFHLENYIMTLLNTTTRNAIAASINAGVALNKSLIAQFAGTTQAQRSALLLECAQIVCDTYSAMPKSATVLAYKASRNSGAPTIGDLMDDGSINTNKRTNSNAAQTANRWFQRNIINAGVVTINRDTPSNKKDVITQRAEWFGKLTGAEQRKFLKLIGA